MEYRADDRSVDAEQFIEFVNQIWPGNYELEETREALAKTVNITAYDGETLVGCIRLLTDGYFAEPSQNSWFCRNIKAREWGAGS